MLLDPIDNEDGTQSMNHEGEFWLCAWFVGSKQIRSMTFEDRSINKFIDGVPPERWSGVSSFKEATINGVTYTQLGKGATTWAELDQFITDNNLIKPEETEN